MTGGTMPDRCVKCGHIFNPKEPRWGRYQCPYCHPCATERNERNAVMWAFGINGFGGRGPRPTAKAFENRGTLAYQGPEDSM